MMTKSPLFANEGNAATTPLNATPPATIESILEERFLTKSSVYFLAPQIVVPSVFSVPINSVFVVLIKLVLEVILV